MPFATRSIRDRARKRIAMSHRHDTTQAPGHSPRVDPPQRPLPA